MSNLRCRGIIAAVKAAQKQQLAELNQALKDQTDDLIVAKIKELNKGKKSSANNYVLNNALSPEEKRQLYISKHTQAARAPPPAGAWAQQPAAQPKASLQVFLPTCAETNVKIRNHLCRMCMMKE